VNARHVEVIIEENRENMGHDFSQKELIDNGKGSCATVVGSKSYLLRKLLYYRLLN